MAIVLTSQGVTGGVFDEVLNVKKDAIAEIDGKQIAITDETKKMFETALVAIANQYPGGVIPEEIKKEMMWKMENMGNVLIYFKYKPYYNSPLTEEDLKIIKELDFKFIEKDRHLKKVMSHPLDVPTFGGKPGRTEVYCRVRPLSVVEQKEDGAIIDGLKVKTEVNRESKVAVTSTIKGVDGLFGMEEKNAGVYCETIKRHLGLVMRGGSVSLFAHGHSGTGKTHSCLGYKDEPGLFKLACKDLFDMIDKINAEGQFSKEEGPLKLQVRFTEVYNGKLFDLNNDRAPCEILENRYGEMTLRSKSKVNKDTSFVIVNDIDHLLKVLDAGIKSRAVGSSSIHDQSSRSHALLEMEIVNEGLVNLRHEIVAMDRAIAKAGGRTGDILSNHFSRMANMFNLIRRTPEMKDDEPPMSSLTGAYYERHCDGDNPRMSKEEWMKKHTEDLTYAIDTIEKTLIPKQMDLWRLKNKEVNYKGPKCLRGTLTLVDLAGADHDSRDLKNSTRAELRESAKINSDLYNLKECMGGLHTGKRLPWRDGNLTKFLKRLLAPANLVESQSIMLATLSPAENQERDSMNTLRYASMVAGFKPPKEQKKRKARVNPRTAKLIVDIKALYKEHTDKTEAEVDKILSKFKGRENVLLNKVRMKYARGGSKSAAKKPSPPPAAEEKAAPAAPQAVAPKAAGGGFLNKLCGVDTTVPDS